MTDTALAAIPITGRKLTLPPGALFHLHRAEGAGYEIGAFRPWAGYKDYGSEAATHGLALFQHVLSFGPTEQGGRTGVHCHLAHAHIVIPTSGLALFSYDGVVTEAAPGSVIVQHGGTISTWAMVAGTNSSRKPNERSGASAGAGSTASGVRALSSTEAGA